MAQIYGELIRAQLQVLASDLTPTATGLVYFNSSTGLKWHTGSGWKTAVDLDSTQSLAGKTLDSSCNVDAGSLPIVSLEKGGLGVDSSSFLGLFRVELGVVTAGQINSTDIPDFTVLYSKLDLADGDIPQAKIENLTTDLGNKVEANTAITGDTKTKITYDAKGLVTAGADLVSADIPATLLSKVVSSTAAMTGALTLPAGNESEKIGLLTQGMIRYNTELATFEGCDGTDWGAIGGGGGSAGGTVVTVPQVAHGLSVGNAVYLNGSTYAKAIATSAAAAEVVGVVSKADLPNEFDLTLSGELTGLSGLTTGEVYFLSAATAGLLTITEPSVIGQVSVPVGVASSTTSLYVAPKRGVVVGGVNARAEVALTSGAVTNVQSVAGMTAGELAGWVFISSAAPKRFYLSAKFSLSGAGGDYNLSYSTTGDTPPAGFLVDITTVGMIRVTLPAASGSTSVINYALNAPAIGTSFPLTVDAGTILSGTLSAARLPDPTTYSDAEATRMGLKIYRTGVAFNGGNIISITNASSVPYSSFVPYQMQNGTWRMKLNLSTDTPSTTARSFQVTGVAAAAASQALSVGNYGTGFGGTLDNTGGLRLNVYSTTSVTSWYMFADIELASKPTWAY